MCYWWCHTDTVTILSPPCCKLLQPFLEHVVSVYVSGMKFCNQLLCFLFCKKLPFKYCWKSHSAAAASCPPRQPACTASCVCDCVFLTYVHLHTRGKTWKYHLTYISWRSYKKRQITAEVEEKSKLWFWHVVCTVSWFCEAEQRS